jgi:uncharacterized membrane protein YfcA
MMEILAYPAAVVMGVLLGLIGGGGSILTLPVMVYMLHIPATEATFYSLFVVGLAALTGSVDYVRKQYVCWRTVLFFGAPSLAATWYSRSVLFPAIPVQLTFGSITISKDVFLLLVFALFMLAAASSMIRPPKVIRKDDYTEARRYRYMLILLTGTVVGLIVGLLAAGGGFLIIPALVILANLPMKKAVGTSLVLIFINSSIGFGSQLLDGAVPDWPLLLRFSAFAVAGIGAGLWIAHRISGAKLRPLFGWFVLATGLFIITKEYIHYRNTSQNNAHVHRTALYQLPR